MIQILHLFQSVIAQCVLWTASLFSSVGGFGVVIAAFIIVLVVSLFLVPLRGSGVTADGAYDFTMNVTHKPKYTKYKGKYADNSYQGRYRGKYEKRPHGGHRASPKG